MCGGTAESDFEPFAEEMLVAKDVMSEAQEESQKEYKKSEITDEAMKKINIERYKINVLKQKIMVKRIQRWIRRILYKPDGELYKNV